MILGFLLGGTGHAVWAACPSGTCYVDDNCSPPTDGTSADPDCTITEGINRAATGDTVLVRAGTYTEEIVFNGSKAITVKRETTSILPKITNTTGTAKVRFDTSGGTANSVLDGFEITGVNTRGVDVSA